jgi:hypothetical protein
MDLGLPQQTGIDLAVPGRPIRSLVAEDRSARGVRDQTGPEPPMLTRLLAHGPGPDTLGQ